VRTLAPDVLYSDSAEFQTLAYTLGMTHSTGYPVYLLLGRLLGFLPIGSPAWRINLLSAVGAGVTVACIFLLTRYVTRSRIGALLGCVALGLSYTFWSQAILAEVYAPGMAFLCLIVLLLWRWQETLKVSETVSSQYCGADFPVCRLGRLSSLPHTLLPQPIEKIPETFRVLGGNDRNLLFAALLAGLGLGVHAFVALIGPAAVIFVVWTLWSQRKAARQWGWSLVAAVVGLALGVGVYLLAYVLIDINNPPSSFYQVALVSSRSTWGLEAADLDTPFERLVVTVTGVQWQDAMFPEGAGHVWEALGPYAEQVLSREFSPLMILCAVLGLAVMGRVAPGLAGFVLMAFITMLFLILNYEPPDKPIFYLPTYALIAIALGAGAGSFLDLIHRHLVAGRNRWYLAFYVLAVAFLTLIVLMPVGASRWQALRAGAATFVPPNYVYPLDNLQEPRLDAAWQLKQFPEEALLLSEWRALYTRYYLAHVEGQRPDIRIKEASPHGGEGRIADTLIQEVEGALQEGRPVFAERVYRNLRDHFRVQPALGGQWYRLSLP